MERIPVDLSGVPETLLWNLGRRAAATRERFVLDDPRAVEVAERLDMTSPTRPAGLAGTRCELRLSIPRYDAS